MSRKNQIVNPVSSFGQKQVESLQIGDQQAKMVKQALLCMEGTHQGMFGPVTVSQEMLTVIADRFNREYESPKNEHDYPPVIKDHNAGVDNVLGRVLPPLVVEEFKNPRTGDVIMGLFGSLRIDDAEAQANVVSGKYAHVSISFDDDMDNLGEFFETSFVAVEAARGSMVLKQGEKNMDLAAMQAKLTAAEGKLALAKTTRKGSVLAMKAAVTSLKLNLDTASTAASEMKTELESQIKSLKTSVLKAQFSDYVRQGKLTKAELDKVQMDEIASMSVSSQKVLLSAYDSRPVSADAFQHGTTGAQPADKKGMKALSSSAVRKQIKAQLAGGKTVKLAADEEEADPALSTDAVDPTDETVVTGLTMEDMEDAMGKLEGLGSFMERIDGVVEKLKGTLGSLEGEVEKEEEE